MLPNRIVDSNTLRQRRPRVETWHSDDRGDWHELNFTLPQGISARAIEKAFLAFGRDWIAWKAKQGWECDWRSIHLAGPFPCAELDKQDLNTYAVKARFKRSAPLLMTLDDAEVHFQSKPQAPHDGAILTQLSKHPEMIEQQARANAAAFKQLPENRKAWERMDRERRELGLPEFKEEDPDDFGPVVV